MRTSEIQRSTAETKIQLSLCLEGGPAAIDTGVGFLDHMLTLLAGHSRFGLQVSCRGDIQVDFHHTVEDIGIALGKAFETVLGDKRGIERYGNMLLPMDEALILSAVDISGRGMLVYDAQIPTEKVGSFDCQLSEEFWIAFARNAGCTLHIRQLSGSNSHPIIEGMFKSVARSLRRAVSIEAAFADEIPSTKGVL